MEITFLVFLPYLCPKKVFGLVEPAPSDPTRRSHIHHEQVFSSKTSASLGKSFLLFPMKTKKSFAAWEVNEK